MMKEYCFSELGYFTVNECEAIKAALQGKSYMNFDVSWSNFTNNCTLIIGTDYEAEPEEIKNFFLNVALGELVKIKKER